MNKLYILAVLSLFAIFMGEAYAVKFNTEHPFSEENKKLAHTLYKGALKILREEEREFSPSPEAKKDLAKKEEEYRVESKKWEAKIEKWETVERERERREGVIGSRFSLRAEETSELRPLENCIESMKLDNVCLPRLGVQYRKIEDLKRTAQNLYNIYDLYEARKISLEQIRGIFLNIQKSCKAYRANRSDKESTLKLIEAHKAFLDKYSYLSLECMRIYLFDSHSTHEVRVKRVEASNKNLAFLKIASENYEDLIKYRKQDIMNCLKYLEEVSDKVEKEIKMINIKWEEKMKEVKEDLHKQIDDVRKMIAGFDTKIIDEIMQNSKAE